MKVFYISSGYDGCYYVRCLVPLVAGGWDGSQTSLLGHKMTNQEMFEAAMAADVVVFQRPMEQGRIDAARLLKEAGKKVVMDNDDTYIQEGGVIKPILNFSSEKMEARRAQWERMLKEFGAVADLVTVSTEFLAKEYRKVNDNVVVLPNCIDPDDWDEPLRNETDIIRIGLVGSVVNDDDYEVIRPIIEDLSKSPKVKLVIFSLPPKRDDTKLAQEIYKDEYAFWLSKDIEWQPFVPMSDYMSTLNGLRLDLMLIPRRDDYFNKAKSNIKFLEASMCEIPVIAQGFKTGDSPYQGKTDSKFMRIAITEQDWAAHITDLVKHKTKRLTLGRLAKKYVLKNYNIHEKINLWEESYKNLWK